MNSLENFYNIQTLIFDVDGVLTDNSVIVMENGQLIRKMNVRDGLALKMAVEEGFKVCIITGGKSKGVAERLKGLGISDIYLGANNKLEAYDELLHMYDLDQDEILYMGDDLPDYGIMKKVGLPVCPANAVPEIKAIAQYISPLKGGEGCVRDVIEKVMKLQNKWAKDIDPIETIIDISKKKKERKLQKRRR